MVVGDTSAIRAAVADYVRDDDVVELVVLDASGKRLFAHGNYRLDQQQLFGKKRAAVM